MTSKKQFLDAFDMEFRDFADKIGEKYDIVNGELVSLDTGCLTVSYELKPYTIYLNKIQKTVTLVVPEKSYLARDYLLRKTDCVTLVNEWLDDKHGTKFLEAYLKTKNREFYHYYSEGMRYAYLDYGFTEVTEAVIGDVLEYAYQPGIVSHVGVYLGEEKILHHLPYKLSSIDILDRIKVTGIYRYGIS